MLSWIYIDTLATVYLEGDRDVERFVGTLLIERFCTPVYVGINLWSNVFHATGACNGAMAEKTIPVTVSL